MSELHEALDRAKRRRPARGVAEDFELPGVQNRPDLDTDSPEQTEETLDFPSTSDSGGTQPVDKDIPEPMATRKDVAEPKRKNAPESKPAAKEVEEPAQKIAPWDRRAAEKADRAINALMDKVSGIDAGLQAELRAREAADKAAVESIKSDNVGAKIRSWVAFWVSIGTLALVLIANLDKIVDNVARFFSLAG